MNLLAVPNTENLFLEMQFVSRKIYVFLIICMFVCQVKFGSVLFYSTLKALEEALKVYLI